MRGSLRKSVSWPVLTIAILAVLVLPAQAQQVQHPCLPFSGTIYFWLTDTWHGAADLTIGRNLVHADVLAINTGFFDAGSTWQGSEKWTLDLGNGNKIRLKTDFIAEHVTDAASTSGVFHLSEVGRFTRGAGLYQNAFGSITVSGPFGPNVKLPSNIQPAPDAQAFAVTQALGSICIP
jgi:hypothetical protein